MQIFLQLSEEKLRNAIIWRSLLWKEIVKIGAQTSWQFRFFNEIYLFAQFKALNCYLINYAVQVELKEVFAI